MSADVSHPAAQPILDTQRAVCNNVGNTLNSAVDATTRPTVESTKPNFEDNERDVLNIVGNVLNRAGY